ncbi:hypothetical protein ASE95_15605 [Sphingomonas sp. Leaf231]|uniref:AMP-binding protein n=1 Tax=Sphingomonas sp. Leaf231 TaxID=1736301 RepID=UPI0006FA1779|nr:AMP-binding protein [Sphingomonas sp. Leaf231]KQN90120.1 hypothetical protein ASE95_15605 [Sphingomonas sp. Leaf231]
MNILAAFAKKVRDHPARVAIVDGRGRSTSYAALEHRAARLAAAWTRRGLRSGDRVLLALMVDADLYASLAALWRIGAVAVFPEPALGLAGLRHAVAATAPRAFVANGIYRVLPWLVPAIRRVPLHLRLSAGEDRIDDLADLSADAHALISFTSGSTGAPKAIARSHGFLAAQDRAVAPLLAAPTPQVDLVGFPVFVVAGLGRGDTSVLPNWPLRRPHRAKAAAVARHCARAGVTRLLLSPAIAERIADDVPPGAATLFVGGGPVFPDLVDRLHRTAPALRIVAVYGSTEAEPIAHHEMRGLDEGEGLIAGMIADGTRVRIEDNEILVAGDHVVSGYLDPTRNASTKRRDADGTIWHRTGDAGRFDADGTLRLLGRQDDRVGALWPFVVEAAARRWPGVRRAALVAIAGRPVLAIEGDRRHMSDWQARFAAGEVRAVARIPTDRRHGAKTDTAALRRQLTGSGTEPVSTARNDC